MRTDVIYYLPKTYFKVCPHDVYFNSREKIKNSTLYQKFLTEGGIITTRFLPKFTES